MARPLQRDNTAAQEPRTHYRAWSLLLLALGLPACASTSKVQWTLLAVQTEGPCLSSAMVWDPTRDVFVLYGGRDRNWGFPTETWEWSPESPAWRRCAGTSEQKPVGRVSHTMVWDAARERMILFGGSDLELSFNDTWSFEGATSRWVRLETTGNPPPRSQHGMVHDPDTDKLIVFGGRGTNHQPLHDTWLLNLDSLRWTQQDPTGAAPHPRARDHVQMARDPLSGMIIMRGASLGPGLADETWHFDAQAQTWSLMQTDLEPHGMEHGLMCSVEPLGGLVLFGFVRGWFGQWSPRTWLYRPQTLSWTLLDATGEQPTSPMDHGQAASDGQHLFVLGGFGGPGVPADAGLTPRGSLWKLSP